MTRINTAFPIVDADGRMTDWFRAFLNAVDRNMPILGTGSPEGVVEAPQYALYIDQNGTAGNIEYRKILPEISGDRSQGWRQV